jgi:hypothetical protein
MPVPAALPAAPPLAVLVLAWDEAGPAVRALVAATQASAPIVTSLLVIVPQANAATHLSAEEYPLAPQLPATPAAAATPLPPVATEPVLLAATSPASTENSDTQPIDDKQIDLLTGSAYTAPAPLAWAAVQVLRLGSLSLPQLAQRASQPLPAPTWTGPTTTPAAPYLGTSAPPEPSLAGGKSDFSTKDLATQVLPAKPLAAAATPPPARPSYEPTEAAQAPDLEADLQPGAADELLAFTLLTSDLIESTAVAWPSPPATQAGWPEALAALRQPASLPELPTAVPAASAVATPPRSTVASHPALQPAAAHYPAPDLNFQIIQYARFAVPVALAEPPFTVIYAPAWPTWLAAQELRQRTGRPLVVHVTTLAAADEESVNTATGWIAELQRQALYRADLILAETPALAQRLRHDLGLPASAVQAVPAADAEAIARALHGARQRPPVNLT